MSINVLQVMSYGAAYPGNFIASFLALEKEISSSGGKMIYVLPQRAAKRQWVEQMQIDGHIVYFLNSSILSASKQLRNLIKRYDINIIHSHFMTYKTYIPIKLARIGNKSISHVVHSHSQPKREEKKLLDFFRKKIIDETLLVGVSDSVSEAFSLRNHKCITVKNSVDFSRLNSFCELKKENYLNHQNDRLILMFGYDFKIKGIDIAINALNKYDLNHQFVLLLCVASNLDEAKRQIIELCGEIPEWIKLLEPREDIASYYHLADAFVSAGRSEGFNYSLVEAAYCKTSIAATDIPGQNELRIPFTEIFESENEESFYLALLNIFSDEEAEREHKSEISREYVISKFSLQNWIAEMSNVYKICQNI